MDGTPGPANGRQVASEQELGRQLADARPAGEAEMSGWLIAITGCIYAYVAMEQYVKGNIPAAITWGSYAMANVGLWMMAK